MPRGRPRTPDSPKQKYPREYYTWQNMIRRCDGKTRDARYYHDRGIRVCSRWRSFENFLGDMGPRPEGVPREWTIERVDNNKGYSPSNCRWATAKEQASNRRPRPSRLGAIVELYRQGRSYKEIAVILGMTPGGVNCMWRRYVKNEQRQR